MWLDGVEKNVQRLLYRNETTTQRRLRRQAITWANVWCYISSLGHSHFDTSMDLFIWFSVDFKNEMPVVQQRHVIGKQVIFPAYLLESVLF